MKVPALKFRVGDKVFAIEMKNIKQFFEVEEILKVKGLPPCVLGITKYNKNVYPLISLKKAWKLGGEDSSTAVAIVFKDKEYAILIDEIIKIEEFEKKETFSIEVFEENGELIGNLNLDFLENMNIPTFKNVYSEEKKEFKKYKNFLLFKCNEEIIGFDVRFLKKVEEYNGKNIFVLNKFAIPLVPFKKIYKDCEAKNIVFLEDKKVMGIVVDEIIDIVMVEEDEIVRSEEGIFNAFFVYDKNEVKVFNNAYLEMKIEKYGVQYIEKEEKESINKKEVLIVEICGEKFGIEMKNVLEISDYKKSLLHIADENPYVKGIVTTREGALYLISLEDLLEREFDESEAKVIVVKSEPLRAFLIERIDDLIYVDEDKIVYSKSPTYIGGVILNKEMIPLLNINFPKDI
jgi:chemotaxis signal transduction protein